ncbi:MAG: iron ABC transporter permease [Crocinitomicaceae bacterium]|nr:iron ABC transporter permease [Crocinitomicaceae bacterium]
MNIQLKFSFSIAVLLVFILVHLLIGSTAISLADYWNSFVNYDATNTNHLIAHDLRVPRMMTAIIAGAGLSLAGLLMQTIFYNPLAEPNILGVSTGSSLFVALFLMTGVSFFTSDWGLISSALLGAFLFGMLILFFARFVRSHGSLLLIGIMLGSFSAAFISIIQTWSDAHQLKLFTLWTMGSLQQVTYSQLPILLILSLVGIVASFFLIKALNALVLGQENAAILGVNSKQTRMIAILIASVLTGIITAFCGPIAFIGIAVPNLVKLVFKTQNHRILIAGSLIFGSVFMLFCDSVVQAIATSVIVPINAITSMIGAPFVIYIILKRWS